MSNVVRTFYKFEFEIVTFDIRFHFDRWSAKLSHNQRDFIDTKCHIAVLTCFFAICTIWYCGI